MVISREEVYLERLDEVDCCRGNGSEGVEGERNGLLRMNEKLWVKYTGKETLQKGLTSLGVVVSVSTRDDAYGSYETSEKMRS